jgi:ribosome modulation factor
MIIARIDPFALGMSAFSDGEERVACPFPQKFFEARQWLLGWDFGRSRSAVRVFADQVG